MPFVTRNDLLVRTRDGRNMVLQEDLCFVAADGTRYVVPSGSATDGASVPRECWPWIPPFGEYWPAAVLHDAAYRGRIQPAIADRASADNLLNEAMGCLGVDEGIRKMIYEAVRMFGEKAWRDGQAAAAQAA